MSDQIKTLMDQLGASGWDGIDGSDGGEAGAQLRDAHAVAQRLEDAERRRQARVFADCFQTDAGQRCLELLRQKTVLRPPTAEELAATKVQAFALLQARRQGAANVVFMIENALDIARGIEAETKES